MTELILQNSYANWVLGEDGNQWIVRDKDGNKLGEFPSHWDERDCMTAIRFGRKFELVAHSQGVEEGKQDRILFYKSILKQTDTHIRRVEEENERLSNKLEKFIIGEEA